jgi:hypothetical protein
VFELYLIAFAPDLLELIDTVLPEYTVNKDTTFLTVDAERLDSLITAYPIKVRSISIIGSGPHIRIKINRSTYAKRLLKQDGYRMLDLSKITINPGKNQLQVQPL